MQEICHTKADDSPNSYNVYYVKLLHFTFLSFNYYHKSLKSPYKNLGDFP